MHKKIRPLIAVIGFLLLSNFGSQDESVAGRIKPTINFYGSVTDTSENSYDVENITVSGMYKQVPFYAKPKNKETDPTINITRIDFAEIAELTVPFPEQILTFNNRQYIEVQIVSKDPQRTTSSFIIELSKRIICDQVNTAGPIEKDLSFKALKKIVFKGHKSPEKEKPAEATK
ncbi:MAG: hypothetical protein EBU90_09010 [Proteobacteria bacterium]|jgi:hypothetical protein|nr:hypothetical protein [Pseudomonadota bacterium]NBP14079.1 hypothetical protein [bacterium]